MYAEDDKFVAECEACEAVGIRSLARFLGGGRWLCDPCSSEWIKSRLSL